MTINFNNSEMKAFVFGNFGTVPLRKLFTFGTSGTWYEYFSNEVIETSTKYAYVKLEPGEFKIYSTVKLNDKPVVTTEFSQYPNPFKTSITFKNISNFTSIKIYSITGQLVYDLTLNEEIEHVSDLSFLRKGMYIVKYEGPKDNMTKRILKI